MAKHRIPIFQNPRNFATVEDGATKGARVGTDLLGPDGKVLTAEQIINPATPAGSQNQRTVWKTILEIPANIKKLAALVGKGFAARQSDGEWALRTLQPGDAIEIQNGDGDAGDPVIGLADVADSGAGTLQAVTVDSKGRVTGTRAATITGTALQIDVANGDAAAGVPTLSLAAEVLASLDLADSAVQEVVAGAGIDVDNTDPRRPVVSAEPVDPGIPDAPADYPHARRAGAWQALDGPLSPYVLLKLQVLTDQTGRVLTDQQGRVLTANAPQIPYAWLTGVPTYRFPPMTLAQANALAPVLDGQPVLITDLAGGREPCWYDETVASGTKWRRFSDRSIAN